MVRIVEWSQIVVVNLFSFVVFKLRFSIQEPIYHHAGRNIHRGLSVLFSLALFLDYMYIP